MDDAAGGDPATTVYYTVVTKKRNYFVIIDRAGRENTVHLPPTSGRSGFNRHMEQTRPPFVAVLAYVERQHRLSRLRSRMSECANGKAKPGGKPGSRRKRREKEGGGGSQFLCLSCCLFAAAGGGAFYYFKILKPERGRQQQP